VSDNGGALPQVVNRWLGIVGLVVAPTTLITSLLYYFGAVSTRKRLLHFGIDPNAIGYTTSDYVTDSVGIVFALALGLLAICAALLLAGLCIRRLAVAGRGSRTMRWAASVLIVLGALATVVGLVGVFGGLVGANVVVFAATLASLAMSAAFVLAGLAIRRAVNAGTTSPWMRWAAWVLVVLGVIGVVAGLIGIWANRFGIKFPELTAEQQGAVTPAALGGAAMVLAGSWMLRGLEPADRQRPRWSVERALFVIALIVVVAAAFWATNIFATKAGEIDGINTAADLWWRQNTVIVDTTERLDVDHALMKETLPNSTDPQSVKTYRYQCLRTLVVRGDQWVLVPAKWTDPGGIAMILTANASTHITVKRIEDPRAQVGNAPNVWKYWPCPELVRTVKGPEVADLQLGAVEIRSMLGDPALAGSPLYEKEPAVDAGPTAFESCAAAADSLTQLPDRSSGFVKVYSRTFNGAVASTEPEWIQQNLLEFQSPLQAGQFVDKVGQGWPLCVHTNLTLNYPDAVQERSFGDVAYSAKDGVVVVASSVAGKLPRLCSHALGAKSNIVVDVQLCASQQPTQATAILDAIRNKFSLSGEARR
jgi:PknH-like extracellular domain